MYLKAAFKKSPVCVTSLNVSSSANSRDSIFLIL
jgi:hypothetical protein